MTDDQKKQALEQMRDAFVTFTQTLLTLPGAPIQKQQAFHRFDEGHMWMQNAILSHQEPEPTLPVGGMPSMDVLPVEQQPVPEVAANEGGQDDLGVKAVGSNEQAKAE